MTKEFIFYISKMTYRSKRYLCYCIYNIKTQNGPKETAHSISSEERLMKLRNLESLCCTGKRSQQIIFQPWDV